MARPAKRYYYAFFACLGVAQFLGLMKLVWMYRSSGEPIPAPPVVAVSPPVALGKPKTFPFARPLRKLPSPTAFITSSDPATLEAHFRTLDTNRDGFLKQDEFFYIDMPQRDDAEASKSAVVAHIVSQELVFLSLDTNFDDQVSPEEFQRYIPIHSYSVDVLPLATQYRRWVHQKRSKGDGGGGAPATRWAADNPPPPNANTEPVRRPGMPLGVPPSSPPETPSNSNSNSNADAASLSLPLYSHWPVPYKPFEPSDKYKRLFPVMRVAHRARPLPVTPPELCVVIPTGLRKRSNDQKAFGYLKFTVDTLTDPKRISAEERSRIWIVLVNINEPLADHTEPASVQDKVDEIVEILPDSYKRLSGPLQNKFTDTPERIRWRAKLALDFVYAMMVATTSKAPHILFMEDDVETAPHIVNHTLNWLHNRRFFVNQPDTVKQPPWGILTLYNTYEYFIEPYEDGDVYDLKCCAQGLVYPNDRRTFDLCNYMWDNFDLMPHDMLMGQATQAQNKSAFVMIPNMVQHMGQLSTLGEKNRNNRDSWALGDQVVQVATSHHSETYGKSKEEIDRVHAVNRAKLSQIKK